MRLYIVRHAIAADRENWDGGDDSLRPVTPRGREKMQHIVRGLKDLDVKLDLIVSSPYVRARETAEILALGLGLKPSTIKFSEALLPGADPSKLLTEIAENYAMASLAVVGHEPHLSSLLSYVLIGNPDMSTNLKKGGVCLVALEIESDGWQATLEWLMTPKAMMAIGEA